MIEEVNESKRVLTPLIHVTPLIHAADGGSAVVLMRPGPTDGYHAMVDVFRSARFPERWNVVYSGFVSY